MIYEKSTDAGPQIVEAHYVDQVFPKLKYPAGLFSIFQDFACLPEKLSNILRTVIPIIEASSGLMLISGTWPRKTTPA
jgi:hypothetical protein